MKEDLLTELTRLKAHYVDQPKLDYKEFKFIDLDSYPQIYKEIIFNIKWPENTYCLIDEYYWPKFKLEDIEWDDPDYIYYDEFKFFGITLWNEDDISKIVTSERYGERSERNFDEDFIQIGYTPHYPLFLNVSNKLEDPEIYAIYPLEKKGENIYFKGPFSVFLKRLIIEEGNQIY